MKNKILLCILTFLISACVSNQATKDQSNDWLQSDFSATGKVAIRYPNCDQYRGCKQEALSGQYTWNHRAALDQFVIYDPLGQQVISLTKKDNVILVKQKQEEREIAVPDMEKELGFSMPFEEMILSLFEEKENSLNNGKNGWKIELKQWQPSGYHQTVIMQKNDYFLRMLVGEIKKIN